MNYNALNQYIVDVQNKPFEWGTHDCLSFVNNACKAFAGYGFAEDIKDYKNPRDALRTQMRWLKSRGDANFLEAMDHRLCRITTALPPRGTVIARFQNEQLLDGFILGICIGPSVAFINPTQGLTFTQHDGTDLMWRLK